MLAGLSTTVGFYLCIEWDRDVRMNRVKELTGATKICVISKTKDKDDYISTRLSVSN